MILQETFAEEQLYLFVQQGEVDEQPHFIMFNTASGAGKTLSDKPTATRTLLTMSFSHPYKVGSIFGGSASIVEYHIIICKMARLTFSVNALWPMV